MSQSRILEDLARFGPDAPDSGGGMSVTQAREKATRLTRAHRENFSVLTRLVPADVRDDFAAVYAFCRTADDLGDEIGDPERARELLAWWREEIDRAWNGEPGHWVFIALGPTIDRFDLQPEPFLDLVSAFEQDQVVTRYETWDQLLDYCRRSADPVGRLVLALLEQPVDEEIARHIWLVREVNPPSSGVEEHPFCRLPDPKRGTLPRHTEAGLGQGFSFNLQ